MGAIGGVMDLRGSAIDFSEIIQMRCSMILRGRVRSSSFLKESVGMLFGAEYAGEDRQPHICERQGRSLALCIDSNVEMPSAVMEKYILGGVEFLGKLKGDFALALYDEKRRILILATDRKGKRPLFYTLEGHCVKFSSEPKALLDGMKNGISVDKDVLAMHLTSAAAIYGAQDIYSDIFRVSAGECIIFTEFGYSRFFYRVSEDVIRSEDKKSGSAEHAVIPYDDFDKDRVSEYLANSLLAFDYPQFDADIPFLMELYEREASYGRSAFVFNDSLRSKCSTYCYEREDRLSSLYGIRGEGIAARENSIGNIEAYSSLKKTLSERFEAISGSGRELLYSIVGEETVRKVLKDPKNEDTEICVRILGMLCQAADWFELRNISLRSEGEGFRICPCFQL